MDQIELGKLIDSNNRYTVAECNGIARSLEYLRRMPWTSDDAEYTAMLDARVCVAIRLDRLREDVAATCAPWFEVQQ